VATLNQWHECTAAEMAEWVREGKREYNRAYYAANPAERLAIKAKRRARKRSATPPLTAQERAQIAALYLAAQQLNLLSAPGTYHVDHIVPIDDGGPHHPSNLRVIRALDNLRKGTRPAGEVPVAFEMTVAP
jgi:5-methylcytosine-specific restriction endonuclease McrA